METNSVLDRYIFNWCQQHGWECPQKENGIWYAIAPNDYMPKPVPLSQSLELSSQQVAAALGVNTSIARESLQCEALTPPCGKSPCVANAELGDESTVRVQRGQENLAS